MRQSISKNEQLQNKNATGAGLGQTQNVTGLKRLTGSQPQLSDNLMSY